MRHSENGFRKSNVFVALLWLNFIAMWGRVYTITTIRDLADSMYYFGIMTASYGLLVTFWVIHNVRIFQQKGPRLGVRILELACTHDSMNQKVNTVVDLRRQEIVVQVVRGEKFFVDGAGLADDRILMKVGG